MTRASFFESPSSEKELSEKAAHPDAFQRWACAVELGQIHEEWSVKLLQKLQLDDDELTRQAAKQSLKSIPKRLLVSGMEMIDGKNLNLEISYEDWKIRTLPELTGDLNQVIEALVIDILGTEGPSTGSRLIRLIRESLSLNEPSSFTKKQLNSALNNLLRANRVARNDFFPERDDLSTSTYYLATLPPVAIRPRGSRQLDEIPATEIRHLLDSHPRARRGALSPDMGYRIISEHYAIKPHEVHIVGGLLEKEWLGIF